MNDDQLLIALRSAKAAYVDAYDKSISALLARISKRWEKMPVNTLGEAKLAEAQRLRDAGLDEKFIKESLKQDVRCRVSMNGPKVLTPKATPKITTWYAAATDIEWSYADVGDHHYSEWQWTIGITEASRYNPIRMYQRNQILGSRRNA